MKRSSKDSATSSAFRALGLAPAEAQVYRILLPQSGATVAEVTQAIGASLQVSSRILDALEKKGLVTYSPEEVPRYSAVPPDIAADVLITRKTDELNQARMAVVKLRESVYSDNLGRKDEGRLVEILTRPTAAQIFQHSIRSVQTEILGLERLPLLVSTTDTFDPDFVACLARGVRCRAITDSELMNFPGTFNRLRMAAQAGEQFRIFPALTLPPNSVPHNRGHEPACWV